jgi:peptidoglycan/xylan/chitin deacetylase (PgdA/CDA1 family)
MTSYVFAYDLEDPDLCLRATPRLVELHRRYEIPATFFVLGSVLERRGAELRDAFGDDPLFDIASHTYSHRPLKDNRLHGPGVSLDELGGEIERGLRLVEEVFERPCVGVRSGYGFYRGLRGERERLRVIRDAGARYLSSDLRGPGDSVPGGLVQAYLYDGEGVSDLLELPGHGWHDNILKGFYPGPWLAWPPVLRWGIPDQIPRTPEEELAVQRVWIDRALALELDYFSPVYHPHSIYLMTPDCRIVELLMRYTRQRGMTSTTYGALHEAYTTFPEIVPGRDAWTWEEQKDLAWTRTEL